MLYLRSPMARPVSAPSAKRESDDSPNCIQRAGQAVDGGMQKAFFKLGWFVGGHPCTVVWIMVLLTALCASGMSQTESETRGQIVWSPDDSNAKVRADQVSAAFGNSARTSTVYIQTKPPGSNVLTVEALNEVVTLASDVTGTTADASYKDGPQQTWTWNDLCERRNGVCWLTSIVDVFDYDTSQIDSAAAGTGGIVGFINDKNDAGTLKNVFGGDITLSAALGGEVLDAQGKLVSATTIKLTFVLENRNYVVDGRNEDPPAQAFEEEALKRIGETYDAQSYTHIAVLPNTPAGQRAEEGAAIQGDLGLVSSSIMIIIVYLGIQLGSCSRVSSRVLLAIGAAATVGFSLLVSYGLGALLTFSSSVHSVLPFLLAGIGVDDVFVIVHEFDLAGKKLAADMSAGSDSNSSGASSVSDVESGASRTDSPGTTKQGELAAMTPQQRIQLQLARGMSHAGSSITVTSVTDLIAFAISGTTVIPALSWFCVWASIAVGAVFVMSCTFFAALLVLDARRQAAGRMDCVPCVRVKSKHSDASAMAPYTQDQPGCCCCCLKPDLLTRTIDNFVAPTLLKPAVKVVVILAFAGLAVVSLLGALDIKQEFRREWFLPSDSYLQDFYALERQQFSDSGVPMAAYVPDVDVYSTRTGFAALGPALLADTWIDNTVGVQDWPAAFKTYLTAQSLDYATVTRSQWESELTNFLNDPANGRFKGDFVWQSGSTSTASMVRVRAFFIGMNEAEQEVEAMNSAKATVAAWASAYDVVGAFAYAPTFPSWALLEVVEREALQNFVLALAAVFVVCIVFLADLAVACIVVFNVALVLLSVVGLMVYWGVSLDSVSMVNLVLAIGLAIDYSAHVAHAFLHKQGTRNERAHNALKDMGVSVINGAVSTFLAVCLLGFSKSYIFVVFFKMFFLSCVIGAIHGLILLPVVLSLIGPAPHREVDHSVPTPKSASKGHQQGGTDATRTKTQNVEMVHVDGSAPIGGV